MTPDELSELERLARAATPGHWTVIDDEYGLRIPEVKGVCEGCVGSLRPAYEKDAAYIAAASPQAVLGLIEMNKKLVRMHENDCYYFVKIEDERDALREKLRLAQEALEHTDKFCVCERFKTPGFDYSETHKRQGKPGIGKRWLTPRDVIRDCLLAIQGQKVGG